MGVTRTRRTEAARRVAAVLFVLLTALAVLAHHELSDGSARSGSSSMAGMSPAVMSATTGSETGNGDHSDHGKGSCPCAADGQMCSSGAVAQHYAPAVPLGLDVPVPTHVVLVVRIVESAVGLCDPPGGIGVLRI